MLRRDVVEAVENKKFNVYAVETVDQVMELLTGKDAGSEDKKGVFPKDTINAMVKNQLVEMNRKRQQFSKQSKSDDNDEHRD